jgi:hypothetical protein
MADKFWIELLALPAAMGAVSNVGILIQEARGQRRSQPWNTRILRSLGGLSAAVVLGTSCFLRPWSWAVLLSLASIASFAGMLASLHLLWRARGTPVWKAVASAGASVFFGVVLLALGGTAGVLDGSAVMSRGEIVPTAHGGSVLSRPVLYELFWGKSWEETPVRPSMTQVVSFDRWLASSYWVKAIRNSSLGVVSIKASGCWIDPNRPRLRSKVVSSMTSGPLGREVAAVLSGSHRPVPCPGSGSGHFPKTLPVDAVLAIWLPPGVSYARGGVAVHGVVRSSSNPLGLVATALPGGYAYWRMSACQQDPGCRSLPAFASPSYALSHELIEAATNPYGNGWFADAPLWWSARYVLSHGPLTLFRNSVAFQGELADLCEPGQLDARKRHWLKGRIRDGPPVAAFYRPGDGCVA